MSRIFIPSKSVDDWKWLLAEPDKHWKRGYSAGSIAHCWQDAGGLPSEVKSVLSQISELETLIAIPEYQVPLPGGVQPSQNDVWVLALTATNLVSIAVEGKVSEPFGPTIEEWGSASTSGKRTRIDYLCSVLGFSSCPPDDIRYQLLHRRASALIEAERLHAKHSVMLVHSFSQTDKSFLNYERFVSLFGASAGIDKAMSVGERNGISLHFSWVRGDPALYAM